MQLDVSFDSYSSGIFEKWGNKDDPTYYIKIVGWGVENGQEFWIVSGVNGEEWGEKGYAKILRAGTCAIFLEGAIVADPKF